MRGLLLVGVHAGMFFFVLVSSRAQNPNNQGWHTCLDVKKYGTNTAKYGKIRCFKLYFFAFYQFFNVFFHDPTYLPTLPKTLSEAGGWRGSRGGLEGVWRGSGVDGQLLASTLRLIPILYKS